MGATAELGWAGLAWPGLGWAALGGARLAGAGDRARTQEITYVQRDVRACVHAKADRSGEEQTLPGRASVIWVTVEKLIYTYIYICIYVYICESVPW